MNKATGGDGIPIELFQILKDDAALNMPTILENSAGVTGYKKNQFSIKSQRKAMSTNAQTTAQLHSFHMLTKQCSKFSKPGFNSM